MTGTGEPADVLRGWLGLAGRIENALEGLAEKDLDLRGGSEGWSIRETVHHIVEANLVASHIVLAGLSRNGHVDDASWVTPDASWMQRLGYSAAPVGPALGALSSLSYHLAELIRASSNGLARQVQLVEDPGVGPSARTLEEVLAEQIEHAEGHLRTVAETRSARGR